MRRAKPDAGDGPRSGAANNKEGEKAGYYERDPETRTMQTLKQAQGDIRDVSSE
jgi:hypothetical protein